MASQPKYLTHRHIQTEEFQNWVRTSLNATCSAEFKESKSIYFRMGWVLQCWRHLDVSGWEPSCKDKQMCQTKPKSPPPHQSTQADVHLSASKHTSTGNSKCIMCKMSSWQKSTLYMFLGYARYQYYTYTDVSCVQVINITQFENSVVKKPKQRIYTQDWMTQLRSFCQYRLI